MANTALGFIPDIVLLHGKTTNDEIIPVAVDASGQIMTASDINYKGWYATEAALTTAYPTAADGDYAIVGTTDTVWIWDSDINAWVDSGLGSLVTSVNGRVGAVTGLFDVDGSDAMTGNIQLDGNWLSGDGGNEGVFVKANGDVGIGVDPSYKFAIGSPNGLYQMGLYHTNTGAYLKWENGHLYLETNRDVTDANTTVRVQGKGAGYAAFRIYDQDNAEFINMFCSNGGGQINVSGTNPGNLSLNDLANSNVAMFSNSPEGKTAELKIYGFKTGDAKRVLEIGVGVDAADTASFDGLSNYAFDGAVKITPPSDEGDLIYFNIDRAWKYRGTGSDAGAKLILQSTQDNKVWEWWSADGTSLFNFTAKNDKAGQFALRQPTLISTTVGAPVAMLTVEQAQVAGAKPVLSLNQTDVSEEFINFIATVGTGNALEVVAAKTFTPTHFAKVQINGSLKYIQIGDIA